MKKYFLTGLATLLPLAVTIYAVIFVVHFLTLPFMGMMTRLVEKLPIGSLGIISSERLIRTISEVIILIGLFVFVFLLGMVARWLFFNALIRWGDQILHKIPLVNKVYKTAKDITRTLFNTDSNSFRQVVMIRFPHRECYCIGLVSNEALKSCTDLAGEEMVSVFIPTTPNPTNGFLMMSPRSELILLDMNNQDAVKFVVSCGVIQPGSREEMA